MNMKNNKGFSLVELIVVIAIMAILAAVAVIGVSVYIPKAQKAADEQMIADIKTAVDLYANLESVQPGQSGYIVIHKNKGTGEVGNVSVGGTMDAFLTDALKATFGDEKYGTELKVAYDGWVGSFDFEDASSINNSTYIKDPSDLMQTVDVLTDALKGFYSGSVEDPQKQANQSVLDVAGDTGAYVKKEQFIAWWTDENLSAQPGSDVFNFPQGTDIMRILKTQLAARYAKYKALVMYTECGDCIAAFGDSEPFDAVTDGASADRALNAILANTYAHATTGGENGGECSVCATKFKSYFTAQGPAADDAKAYLAMLGKIDDMSETIASDSGFGSDNFYNGEFIGGIVNDYVVEVQAYANAVDGDIVISVVVDSYGNIKYNVPNVKVD